MWRRSRGAASQLLSEMKELRTQRGLSAESRYDLKSAITYFTNQKERMDYAKYRERNLSIGSGVTQAACKVIVKQRLCASGMKWVKPGATIVLALRSLAYSYSRWAQFWQKIDRHRLSLAA